MMKWIREIRKVGFKNWFWFVVLHNRNEFHHKFGILNYPQTKEGSLRCMRERNRAHELDEALN